MKPDENPRDVEKIIILTEKRDEILNKLRQTKTLLYRWKAIKYLSDSTVSVCDNKKVDRSK